MIRASEEFALNVPSVELLHHTQYLGSVSGRDANKLDLTKLPTFKAQRIEAPLLEGCLAYIECGVADAYTIGDHTLYVGKVLAAQVETEAFDGTWRLEDDEGKPLHYLGLNHYALLDKRIEARVPEAEAEESVEEQVEEGVEDVERETRERKEREGE
jgi:flavin reductase (DIM6/NTAB) family NADH-FMN oxidoreductase RutF